MLIKIVDDDQVFVKNAPRSEFRKLNLNETPLTESLVDCILHKSLFSFQEKLKLCDKCHSHIFQKVVRPIVFLLNERQYMSLCLIELCHRDFSC